MDLQERINSIKDYFQTFNISEGIAYALVCFPNSKWVLPEAEYLQKEYKVKVVQGDGYGIYFCSEITNGIDKVFDAIDFVIMMNKSAEQRAALLSIKMNELKELFTKESIERLEKLKFTFEDEEKEKEEVTEKKNVKEEKKVEEKSDKKEEKKEEEKPKKGRKNSSLVNMAQEMTKK